jgi:hypothetical protein
MLSPVISHKETSGGIGVMPDKLILIPTPDEILVGTLRKLHKLNTKEGNVAGLKVFEALSDEGKTYAFEQLLRIHLQASKHSQELESYIQAGAGMKRKED